MPIESCFAALSSCATPHQPWAEDPPSTGFRTIQILSAAFAILSIVYPLLPSIDARSLSSLSLSLSHRSELTDNRPHQIHYNTIYSPLRSAFLPKYQQYLLMLYSSNSLNHKMCSNLKIRSTRRFTHHVNRQLMSRLVFLPLLEIYSKTQEKFQKREKKEER